MTVTYFHGTEASDNADYEKFMLASNNYPNYVYTYGGRDELYMRQEAPAYWVADAGDEDDVVSIWTYYVPGTAYAGNGNDTIYAEAYTAETRIYGGLGNDTFIGVLDGATLFMGEGNDIVTAIGGRGNYYLGDGNDTFDGEAEFVFGGNGNDFIHAYVPMTANGGDGNDGIAMNGRGSVGIGGAGDDLIYDFSGGSKSVGGDGNDKIYVGNDSIANGGAGEDEIFIWGDAVVSLGSGRDRIIFDYQGLEDRSVKVCDFVSGEDIIDISGISGLSFGGISYIGNMSVLDFSGGDGRGSFDYRVSLFGSHITMDDVYM